MSKKSPFGSYLEDGEKIVASTPIVDESGVDFDVMTVASPGMKEGDRVLLNIATKTGDNVLIGGNPLGIDVLRGAGRLVVTDLKDGSVTETQLEPGQHLTIPSDNVVYSYENTGNGNLMLRDTCLDFSLAHEPSAQDVVHALSRTLIG